MTTWQKNLLQKKLLEINKHIEHRKWVTSIYEWLLKKRSIQTVKHPEHCEPIFLRYPLLAKDKKRVLEEAKKRKIEIGDWFVSPLHPIEKGLSPWGYQKGMCSIAESVSSRIINLPTHTKIDKRYIKKLEGFMDEMQPFIG